MHSTFRNETSCELAIKMDESDLERLAREELLREAKRGASRADLVGPQGWKKCPVPKTNKRFLRFEVISAVSASMKLRKTSSNPTANNKRPLSSDREVETVSTNTIHKKKRSDDNRNETEKRFSSSPQQNCSQ